MAAKKTSSRAAAPAGDQDPTKAQLQRRMEEAREDISQTVEEIKETVTEQYESVKEAVVETLDWRAQFRKHSVAWSLGALAVGYVVGSGIAASIEDATPKKKGRKSSGLFDEIYAIGDKLSDEFSEVAQTIILPALGKKIKEAFGIDLTHKLRALAPPKRTSGASKSTKRSAAKKSVGGKRAAKKSASGKRAAKKST